MRKRGILIAGIFLLAGLSVLIYFGNKSNRVAEQAVVLGDGTRFTITDATYGTNHVTGSASARMLMRLPNPLRDWLRPAVLRLGTLQTRTTPRPALVIWHTNASSSLAYGRAYLGDAHGVVAGEGQHFYAPASSTLKALEFEALPRRSKTLQMHIHEKDMNGEAKPVCVVTNIPNPAFAKYPQWTPEDLPTTKKAEDLEVRLSQFGTGFGEARKAMVKEGKFHEAFGRRATNEENYTVFQATFKQGTITNATWTISGVTFSDATGNRVNNRSMMSGSGWYRVAPSLWPGESAWKVTLEVKRYDNFQKEELVTFKDVPLGVINQTNILGLSTNINGVQITLKDFIRKPQSSKETSELRLIRLGMPEGYHLDLVAGKSGTNNFENGGFGSSGNDQQLFFWKIPQNATTADFTFALHAARTVEFLVKPTVTPPEFTIPD